MIKKKIKSSERSIAIVYIKISSSFDPNVNHTSQIIPFYRILIVFIYLYPKAVSISQHFTIATFIYNVSFMSQFNVVRTFQWTTFKFKNQ